MDADEKFSKAVEALKDYEERYHPIGIQDRINKAKENDMSSSSILSWLKAKERVRAKLHLRFISV